MLGCHIQSDMGYQVIILLAIALGMDCFSVALATGLTHKSFQTRIMISMAVLFGLFQAIMPLMGWLCTVYSGNYLSAIDHWIAFGLLVFIGVRMVIDGARPEAERNFDTRKASVRLTLAVATSIDALAVGVSFTCMGMDTWEAISAPILVIGLTSFIMSLLGNLIGITIGRRFRFPAEIIGGIILISIGIKILYEHLFES